MITATTTTKMTTTTTTTTTTTRMKTRKTPSTYGFLMDMVVNTKSSDNLKALNNTETEYNDQAELMLNIALQRHGIHAISLEKHNKN